MPFDGSEKLTATYRRLLAVTEVVRSLSDAQFNIDVYYSEDYGGCGSVGCALGWAVARGVLDDVKFSVAGIPVWVKNGAEVISPDIWAGYFGITVGEGWGAFFATTKWTSPEPRATRTETLAKLEALCVKYAPVTVAA